MSDSRSGAGMAFPVILGALICAAFGGLLADLMTPYGPVVLTLGIAFAALTLVAGVLSFLPPLTSLLRPVATFALINAIVCGVLIGLWYIAPKPAATERGVVASMVPFGSTLQSIVVTNLPKAPPVAALPSNATPQEKTPATPPPAPASPADAKQQALLAALASADPAQRLRASVSALNERDPATLAGVVETLYRSPDPAIRQLAVKRLLTQRRGARLPLLATPANAEAQALANALQSSGLTVRTINETSGAFEGGVCGPTGMTGSVNRSGVTMSARCRVGEADRAIVLVLQPTDDFQLSGEARDDQGHVARVQAPLL